MQEKKLFRVKDNEGYFEAQVPFKYSDNDNVIGHLHNNDRECICLTTIPESKLVSIDEKPD